MLRRTFALTKACLALAVLLLAACAEEPKRPTPAPAPTPNLTGYSNEFKQGHADGCSTARGTRKRDEKRFKSDANYAQGWQDGHDFCRARK